MNDNPGPESDRANLERYAIALVSNYDRPLIDPRLEDWLGMDSPSEAIRNSGHWNVNHIEESHDRKFLDRLEEAIEDIGPV